jgi:hypothetical protein
VTFAASPERNILFGHAVERNLAPARPSKPREMEHHLSNPLSSWFSPIDDVSVCE